MDIDKLRTIADTSFKHSLFRKNLRERIEAQLVVTHNNGLFKASPTLIAFLHCLDTPIVYLEDEYANPIRCEREELLARLKEAHQIVLNQWHIDFEESKKIRKSSDV